MTAWRMAFRNGTNGYDLWPECRRLGIAIIQYTPVNDINLRNYPHGEPRKAWKQLSGTQPTSLKRFVGEMKKGDTIYVKSGPKIVGKGVIQSDYIFDSRNRVRHKGVPWQHQRRVKWLNDIPEIDDSTPQSIVTVKPLSLEDVRTIEAQYGHDTSATVRAANESDIEGLWHELVTLTQKRSRSLRNKAFRNANGICSVCERDYSQLLGGRGIRVLQVHHKRMLSKTVTETRTTLDDLVVVCANCHLLLHLNHRKPLTVKQLQKMLHLSNRQFK